MQKIWKGILSLSLAVAFIAASMAAYGAAQERVALAATDYYAPITATGGDALLGQVHDLITETHDYYSSYNDCRSKGTVTDPGEGNNTVMEFYTHIDISATKWDTSGGWNREHVWPKSDSNGLWGTSGGGSDLHHIRPAEKDLNNSRGNKLYGEVGPGGTEEYTSVSNVLGGHSSSSTFEPLDNVKGDVARIVMYVYTHYNTYSNAHGTTNGGKGGPFGTLNFKHIISASSETAAQKMLLQWNRLDPVDAIETRRNEAVYQIQGNRNPFIDHPEYADAIWGDGSTPIDPPPSDTLKSLSLSATAITLNVGETYNLTVTPNPINASASVNWTSSDNAVATVSNGRVTAKAAGTAKITATSTGNSAIKASATVTVLPSSSSGTTDKVTITRESFPAASGGYEFQQWSAGGISGIAFMYGGKQDGMQFNISKKSYYLASDVAAPAPIKSVTVKSQGTDRPWKLLTSASPYGEVEGKPQNGNDRGTKTVTAEGVTWAVSGNDTYFALTYELVGNSGVAYLDSIEVEYGSGGGSVELQGLLISPSEFTLAKGESIALTARGVPSGAGAEVAWSSSNPSVATVSADGTVTATGAGNAVITATSKTNGAIKATATVKVTAAGETGETDAEKIEAFRDAVASISDEGSFAERFARIKAAVAVYKTLNAAEAAEAETDYEALSQAIARYNGVSGEYNSVAEKADAAALNGVGKVLGA